MYERFISSSMLTGTLLAAISVIPVGPAFRPGVHHLSAWPSGRACERLDIEVLDVEGVVLDELAARLDLVAHERGENQGGRGVILGPDLEQRALGRIHRGFPQRVGVHLAEALVAVDGDPLLARGDEELDQLANRLAP